MKRVRAGVGGYVNCEGGVKYSEFKNVSIIPLNISVTSLFMFFLHSPQFEFQLCNITATKDYKIHQVRKIWRARTKTRGCPHSPGENSRAPLSFLFFFFLNFLLVLDLHKSCTSAQSVSETSPGYP